jgi:prepilin-type N-terminal cleavage/methylation domain-containing protein
MKWIGISSFIKRGTQSRTRGFNLTELAIVLVVGGIILGGIWVVAANGWENSRQTTLKTDISTITKNVRAFYAGQNGVSGLVTPSLTSLSPPAIPGDMLRAPGVSGCAAAAPAMCADHPWGASTALTVQNGSLILCGWAPGTTVSCAAAASNAQYFAIELDAISDNSCIAAALNNSGADAPPGLYDVVINGISILSGNGVTHQFPPLPSDLQNLCTASSTIDFVYRIVTPQS